MLGRTARLWVRLKTALQEAYGPLDEEWTFAGKHYGWSFRLKQKKRALVYLTPCRGYFLASFALGEKACRTARGAGVPSSILAIVDAAPKYAEEPRRSNRGAEPARRRRRRTACRHQGGELNDERLRALMEADRLTSSARAASALHTSSAPR
jgi:hypothetical protein